MAAARRPNEPIKTQRLVLREARQSDLSALHELYRNKEVMLYWADPHEFVSRTQMHLDNMIKSPNNGIVAFVIVLLPSAPTATSSKAPVATAVDKDIVIGHAGIWMGGKDELVFMLDHTYWRKGYMTEVLTTLVPIFWERGLEMVSADVDPANEGSLKLLRGVGFQQTGENIVEFHQGKRESTLHMELRNPNSNRGKKGGDGSDRSSGDSSRT